MANSLQVCLDSGAKKALLPITPAMENDRNGSIKIITKGNTEIVATVWAQYGTDEKFPAIDGDRSEEHATTDAPGTYGIEDTATLDSTLGFPAASVDKIDEAASLVHMTRR